MSFLNASGLNSRDKKKFHGGRARPYREQYLTGFDGSLAGKRCLVLDDEFLIALDIQNILEVAGAVVTCVADADEALTQLGGSKRFDLAIIDVMLGNMVTSTAVTGRLIELGIPFVFLTGMRSDDVNLRHPGVPVVEKPYVAEVLLRAAGMALIP